MEPYIILRVHFMIKYMVIICMWMSMILNFLQLFFVLTILCRILANFLSLLILYLICWLFDLFLWYNALFCFISFCIFLQDVALLNIIFIYFLFLYVLLLSIFNFTSSLIFFLFLSKFHSTTISIKDYYSKWTYWCYAPSSIIAYKLMRGVKAPYSLLICVGLNAPCFYSASIRNQSHGTDTCRRIMDLKWCYGFTRL